MCYQHHLFISLTNVNIKHIVHLPDGSTKIISQKGSIELENDITLLDVLYVP